MRRWRYWKAQPPGRTSGRAEAQSPDHVLDLVLRSHSIAGFRRSAASPPDFQQRVRGAGPCPKPARGRAGNRRGLPRSPSASRPICIAMARSGWSFGIAQHVEHHHAVRHGRVNRAQPVLAVQALGHPGDGLVRAPSRGRISETATGSAASTRSTPRKKLAQAPLRFMLYQFVTCSGGTVKSSLDVHLLRGCAPAASWSSAPAAARSPCATSS